MEKQSALRAVGSDVLKHCSPNYSFEVQLSGPN